MLENSSLCFATIRTYVQKTVQGVSLLGITSWWKAEVRAHAWKTVQVHNQGHCACAEGCVVHVLACKCHFVHERGLCICAEDYLV